MVESEKLNYLKMYGCLNSKFLSQGVDLSECMQINGNGNWKVSSWITGAKSVCCNDLINGDIWTCKPVTLEPLIKWLVI